MAVQTNHKTTTVLQEFDQLVSQLRQQLEQLEDKATSHNRELQQTLHESEMLYQTLSRLTNARTPHGQLEAMLTYAAELNPANATILYLDNDEQGQPIWGEIAATWEQKDVPKIPIGTRYYLPEIPFTQVWTQSPDHPQLIEDLETSEVIDPVVREIYRQIGVRSSAIIPLTLQGRWVGLISLSWTEPHEFTEANARIFQAIGQQAATAIDSIRATLAQEAARLEIEKRARDMETVTEVSTAIASVLDVNELLQTVADLTKKNFHHYHAHIYMLDASGRNLVLAAGAGEVGRQMLGRGHQIPLNRERSVVARAARNGEIVIVNDVVSEEDFLPNPLLPDTRAEMAVPIMYGSEVIGVLDIQDEVVNSFNNVQAQVKLALANQIAVAVQNARAFEQVAVTAKENLDLRFALDEHAIVAITDQRGIIQYVNNKFCQISKYPREELLGQDHRIINSSYHSKEFIRDLWVTIANGKVWKGEIRNKAKDGSLYWVDTTIVPFLNEEGKPYQYVAIRYDITSRKTYEAELSQRLKEMETVSAVGLEIAANLELDVVLESIVNLTKANFDRYHAQIYLLDENGETLRLAAGAGEVGKELVAKGHSIPLNRENSLVARVARTWESIAVNDVTAAPDFLPNPLLPETKSELATPITFGDKLIGVLDVQDKYTDRFTEVDVQVNAALANQIAVAIQNARAFEQIQVASSEITRIYSMSQDLIGTATLSEATFTSLNPAWEQQLGYTAQELMSKPFIEFVHPDDRQRTNDEVAYQLGQGKNSLNFENRYFDKSGNIHWLSWNVTVSGNNLFFTARNITEQKRAEEEIRKRAADMQVVTEVGAQIATTLQLDMLLDSIVNLTKANFDRYHVQIYLLDEKNETLRLAAGAGEVGQLLVEQAHYIPLSRENSLVARAARTRQSIAVNDVSAAPDFLPNPLLPETRSELTVPIMFGDLLIGVLDIQDKLKNRFTEVDIQVKTVLANQIAVAIQNARAFEQIQETSEEISRIYNMSIDLIGSARLSDGMFTSLNPAWERTLGYTIDELMSKPFLEFVHPDDLQPTLDEVARQLSEGTDTLMFENRYLAKDGSVHVLLWNTTVVGDMGYFITRDITERKQIEEERERMLARAEEQAAFERETSERLREVDRLKSQFLANMSHELRTPLNSIIGYAEVLLDGDDGELSEEAVEDVDTIHSSGQHLLAIINDILDLAKIEAGQMQINCKEIDLMDFAKEVVHAGQILVKDKLVTLKLDAESPVRMVYADPIRLRQIIWNLVSNAVKFTEKGAVTLSVGMQDDHNAYVKVTDTGIGMAKDDLGVIFDQFRQVDGSSTRRAGGTGLGLTITRHLINLHGGEISVDSEMGVGSAFTFTLPVTVPAQV